MKKLHGSFGAKLTAVILLCVMALIFAASTLTTAFVYECGGYNGAGEQQFLSRSIASRGYSLIQSVGQSYQDGAGADSLWPTDSNFRYTLVDGKGRELYSNYDGSPVLWQEQLAVLPDYSLNVTPADVPFESSFPEEGPAPGENPAAADTSTPRPVPTAVVTPTPRPVPAQEIFEVYLYREGKALRFEGSEAYQSWRREWEDENRVMVTGYVLSGLPAEDEFSVISRQSSLLYSLRYAAPVAAALSLLLGILLYIFLLRAAGHRQGSEEVTGSWVEKIPFDLLTLLILGGMFLCFGSLEMLDVDFDLSGVMVLSGAFLVIGLLFLLWSVSLAVRLKLACLLKSCLSLRLLNLLWGGVKALGRGIRTLIRHLPILWKWLLGLGAVAFIDLVWRMSACYSEGGSALGWILLWLVLGSVTLYAVLAFRRLRLGAEKIAGGELGYSLSTQRLIGDFKAHAEDLNHIRDGMNAAVEERLKSERLRTQLITNVSHDIKTPLTSIVNYVDLLSREQPESETQREYLEVLARQSAKLKKLIEDLIEASKASTGNLPVQWEKLELGVLLDQAAGEYGERFAQARLEVIVNKPQEPVEIAADGRHMWRVFDNLMSNILKYALPGTRVYLDLRREGSQALVSFRNISRERLNIQPEELMERFTRGDSSRSAEGNGLGLSIAMSLVKLQRGEMRLTVDGDLFKVELRFDALAPQKS